MKVDNEFLPFDLDKALAGWPVVTRGGRQVTQLKLFDYKSIEYPLIGVLDGNLLNWTKDGKSFVNPMIDLFLTEKTVKYYAYVVHDNDDYGHMKILGPYAQDTELAYLKSNLIKKIEFEVPEDVVEQHELVRESITKDYDELIKFVKKISLLDYQTSSNHLYTLATQAMNLLKKFK